MTVKLSPFPKVPTWWDWFQVELCFSIKIPIVPRMPAGIESNLNEEILAPVSSDDDINWLYHCITNSPSDFITLHCLKTLSHYTRLYHITLPRNNVVPLLCFAWTSYTHFKASHCVIMTSLSNGPWTHLLNLVTVLLRSWEFVCIFVLLLWLIL